uniref:Uncharacterized protein n=1 Tax=Toxoplasma gondii COUG TaxID=1074873 RepID=A0A2G8Y1Z7_TOXGO|nr:hypothetical protein TGCOUG_271430A [Toxoplasma gondii COUG]
MESDLESGSDLLRELNFNSDDEPPSPQAGDVTVVSPDGCVTKTIVSLGKASFVYFLSKFLVSATVSSPLISSRSPLWGACYLLSVSFDSVFSLVVDSVELA